MTRDHREAMRRIALSLVFAALGFGLLGWLLHVTQATLLLGAVGGGVLGGVAIAIGSGALAVEAKRVVVAPNAPAPPPRAFHPYRGAVPALPAAAALSGRRVALVLAVALLATACAVPLLLHRARWIEIESVLLAWWAVWAVTVGLVAYRGHEAADDHELAIAFPLARAHAPARRPPRRGGWGFLADLVSAASDGEAILVALLLAIAVVLVFAGAWVLLEIVCPCLFFVAYAALRGALRRSRGHAGSLRAGALGMVWATVYTAPLAVLVWVVHALAA